MKKFTLFIIILLLFSSFLTISTYASSSGDDDDSSSGGSGGGGGGGGSPNFFDYYIPLIFDETHPNGISEVKIWVAFPSVLITTFAQNEFGSNVAQLLEPTILSFNPMDNQGLTNGSLIRVTSPAQVIGQRVTEDIQSDNSFAYSILPRRMMGFEYDAPFDGKISLMSLNPSTRIQITDPDGSYTTSVATTPGETITLNVKKGSYINSSFPTVGAFYSKSEGTSASMAVPRYMHGSTYYFNGDLASESVNEIDRSYFRVNPREATELTIHFRDGSNSKVNIFGVTDFALSENIVGVESSRGKIEVNIRSVFDYGGNTRVSTVQLFAIKEMRAAEVFLTPEGFTSHFSSGVDENSFNFTSYDQNFQNYVVESRENEELIEMQSFPVNSPIDFQFLSAIDYMFGFSVSPGKVSHPMAPSAAFLNLPLNSVSQKNITGLLGTWYRIPNLAVMRIDIIPGPVEEYTGQLIQIEVKANGSLPVSQFRVEIVIDEEIEVDETYDFLQVNESIVYDIRKFLPVGQDTLNISIDIDVDDQVSELNEDDNFMEEGYNVQNNIRLRFSIAAILILGFGYLGYRLRLWLKQRRSVTRAHVDAILTFEEEE